MNAASSKREIKGFWWLPDHPEDRWFGVLTLDVKCAPVLEVFLEAKPSNEEVGNVRQAIHGQDEHGKPITLLFASTSELHESMGLHGVTTMVRPIFGAGYALLGIAVPDADTFVAHELVLQVQHLYGWLGISGFDKNRQSGSGETTIHYRHPEEQKFAISPDLEIGIRIVESSRSAIHESTITETASLYLRSSLGFKLGRCIELMIAVRHLLHFAVLKPVHPVQMTAFNDAHGRQIGNEFFHEEVEIYSSILREAESEMFFSPRWVFRYEDVRTRFIELFRMWLDYVDKFDEALGCYAATVYFSLPETMKHLSLTQALEAYHGIKFQSHDTLGFKAKIEALASGHAASLRGLVDDIPAFAAEVKLTRDYYTHHNPEKLGTGKVAERDKLFRMNAKLRLLFQMCVLTDIGIPADRFARLRRQLATTFVNYG